MHARLAVILLLLLGALQSPDAQTSAQSDADEPAWLVLERAERLMQQAEYGRAILEFRRASQLQPNDPEPLFGLGRAYKEIGDVTVAEEYLQAALDKRVGFRVPDRAVLVRYERADIYRARRDFARYERELEALIAEHPIAEDALVPQDARAVVLSRGLDRFVLLYRLPESAATRARGMLGELLVRLGRYNSAAEHLTIAVLQSLTTLIEAGLRRDPTYEFTSVAEFIRYVRRYPETRDYLQRTRLFHDLYYLAAAFWGEREEQARPLWETLALVDPDGGWGNRAARQLENPRPEPLLVPTR